MRWTTTLITVCMATLLVVSAWMLHDSTPTRSRGPEAVPLVTQEELPRDAVDAALHKKWPTKHNGPSATAASTRPPRASCRPNARTPSG